MLKSITLGDLRELLVDATDLPDGVLVVVTADYGDYHHTPQALPLTGELELRTVQESGYSQSGYEIVRHSYEDDEQEEGQQAVLLLR